MGCDVPVSAWWSREYNPATKRHGITFNKKSALPRKAHETLKLPCGRCVGCRLERSHQWATRCMHEKSQHEQNCFVTLTFAEKHYPVSGSIQPRDLQLFMKRLRKAAYPAKVRFFACGEYGDKSGRAHYHALLFGYDPPDKTHWETTKQGHKLYLSALMQDCWPFGLAPIGALTYQSAAYTARYAMKKIGGQQAEQHYLRVHPYHGFITRVRPEFLLMSRRPGLGQGWFEKFGTEAFTHDSVIVDGREARPPRFYFNQLSEEDKARITKKRTDAAKAAARPDDGTFNKYQARTETRAGKMSTLQRKI